MPAPRQPRCKTCLCGPTTASMDTELAHICTVPYILHMLHHINIVDVVSCALQKGHVMYSKEIINTALHSIARAFPEAGACHAHGMC
jgi:hypothetical protein